MTDVENHRPPRHPLTLTWALWITVVFAIWFPKPPVTFLILYMLRSAMAYGVLLSLVGLAGIVMFAAAVASLRVGWRRLVLHVAGASALLVMFSNWSLVAPTASFVVHRPLFDAAVLMAPPSRSYYGSPLPIALAGLTVDGHVSRHPDALFFPQWMWIPDDAGGYFWSPKGSPAGTDMYGMLCTDPVDLGGGWWSCAMP